MQELKQHRYGKLFPSLGMEERAELTNSIASKGLLHAVTLFENRVLDGWHRYTSCIAAGVKPKMVQFEGTEQEALDYVVTENIERRHLRPVQRVKIGKEKLKIETGLAKERRIATQGRPKKTDRPRAASYEKSTAAARVAKQVGVSARTMERSIAIDKRVIPAVKKAVDSGRMSLREGERVAKLKPSKQASIVKLEKTERIAKEKPEDWDLGVLKRTWAKASEKTKRLFLKWIKE